MKDQKVILNDGKGEGEEVGWLGGCDLPKPQRGLVNMSMGNQLPINNDSSKQCPKEVSTTLSPHEDIISTAQTKSDIYPPISTTQIASCYI
jgi:hypothetical protein